MTQHPWLDTSPFFLAGNEIGVLLIHGFTGAPTEMRPLGQVLADQGYTVSGPRLPGHGTTPEDLANRSWTEWLGTVETAYRELAARCNRLFVGGLSLGSLLTIHLAALPPDGRSPDGIALFSPAIWFADARIKLTWIARLVPFTVNRGGESDLVDPEADSRGWCYSVVPARAANQVYQFNRHVRRLLPSVAVPTLVVMSTGDRELKFESGPYVLDQIGSRDKELVTLHHSGHNVLVDGERETVWRHAASFISRLAEKRAE